MTAIGQFGGPGPGRNLPPGDAPVQRKEPSKLSLFDYVTRLGVPLVFAFIAILQRPAESWRFWTPLGLAFVSFVIGIYHPSKTRLEQWLAWRRDKKRARTAYPRLKRFIARFGRFVEPDGSDALGRVVRKELQEERVTNRDELGATRERLFERFWSHLHNRLTRQDPDFEAVLASISEFNTLVSQYVFQTVQPVYEGIPQEVELDQIPEDAKRELEAFREQLVRFLDEYGEFVEELAESLETRDLDTPTSQRPKPLP